MEQGLCISVVDPDDDYIGIDVHVSNERSAGTAFIYAGLDEPGKIADILEGFPARSHDERHFYLGSRDEGVAGGYCQFRFFVLDASGHCALEAVVEDDTNRHAGDKATLSVTSLTAADIDRFVDALRKLGRERRGEARLASSR